MTHNRSQLWVQEALEGVSHNRSQGWEMEALEDVSHNKSQGWAQGHWRGCPATGVRGELRVTKRGVPKQEPCVGLGSLEGLSHNRGQGWAQGNWGMSHNMSQEWAQGHWGACTTKGAKKTLHFETADGRLAMP